MSVSRAAFGGEQRWLGLTGFIRTVSEPHHSIESEDAHQCDAITQMLLVSPFLRENALIGCLCTHKKPTENMSITCIFFLLERFKPQSWVNGRANMAMSNKMLTMAWMTAPKSKFRHVPSAIPSHCIHVYSTGLHWNMNKKVKMPPYSIEIRSSGYATLRKGRDGKSLM